MLSKSQIQFVRSLQHKKFREQSQCFVAEGSKLVLELINSSFSVEQVYALTEWVDTHQEALHHIPVTSVTAKEMSRISGLSTAAPALAICRIPEIRMNSSAVEDTSPSPESGLGEEMTGSTLAAPEGKYPVLLLDEIRDPGNLGTIIRIADWFGIPQIIGSPGTVDLYNPKVIQATMGSITRVKVTYAPLQEFLRNLGSEIPVYALAMEGERLYDMTLKSESVWIVGSEAHGLSDGIAPFVTHKIAIPHYPSDRTAHAESLNAAVATGIACAWLRQ